MFESSLIQKHNPGRTRWIALTSIAIQGSILAAFLIVPLLWPETLPLVSVAPKMTSITLKKPEVKIQPKPQPVVADNAYHPPSVATTTEARGSHFFKEGPSTAHAMDEPTVAIGSFMAGNHPLGLVGSSDGTGGPVVVAATPKNTLPIRLSSGVSAGLLLAPIRPIYPPIALMARIQGTVVVTAIIDKQGHITGLQILSGPEMLKRAAADAIKEARYRPYLLNGEPTEVITTISVNFQMGS